MKHLPFAFAILALACILLAIWRSDFAFQAGLSSIVFILAAAAAAGAQNQVKK